eukprot:4455332-Pyramimonas_sp.AAC.1
MGHRARRCLLRCPLPGLAQPSSAHSPALRPLWPHRVPPSAPSTTAAENAPVSIAPDELPCWVR